MNKGRLHHIIVHRRKFREEDPNSILIKSNSANPLNTSTPSWVRDLSAKHQRSTDSQNIVQECKFKSKLAMDLFEEIKTDPIQALENFSGAFPATLNLLVVYWKNLSVKP